MFCQRFTNLSIREAHDEEGKAQPLVQAEMMVMEKSLGYGWKGADDISSETTKELELFWMKDKNLGSDLSKFRLA